MTLPASEETVPATDEVVRAYKQAYSEALTSLINTNCSGDISFEATRQALGPILSATREQAVRECESNAAIMRVVTTLARTDPSEWLSKESIHEEFNRILSLIDRSAKT